MSYYSLKSNNIIIFDWDDTLCPTTVITSSIFNQITPIMKSISNLVIDYNKKELEILDKVNVQLLNTALSNSTVAIISNADDIWIKKTGEDFLPLTFSFIINNNIPIISARKFSLQKNIKNHHIWKDFTFHHYLLNEFNNNNINTILSIGDSILEQRALENFSKFLKLHNKSIYSKTIKYIDKPNIESLIKQNLVINRNINVIVNQSMNNTLYMKNI